MAGISDDDIRRVREASDLVSIAAERMTLRQKGRDFWGCCPFHGEKTPSFKIDPNTQLWHCFGCSQGGDVFSFVMKRDEVGFLDAVRDLAKRANIELTEDAATVISRGKKARLKDVCNATAEFYHTQLMRGRSSAVQEARRYLGARDLGSKVSKDWTLGFAPGQGSLIRHLSSLGFTPTEMVEANVALAPLRDTRTGGSSRDGVTYSINQVKDRFFNRIMFPIRDIDGEVIAFGGRVVGKGEPKYLNSQETAIFHKSEVLYGIEKAKGAMAATGTAIIVEGYTDVIILHEAGVKNVVATLGTALTKQHVRALSRHAKRRIVYLFDGDEAGQRACDRAAKFLDESMLPEAGRSQIQLCAVTLPDGLDPADFVIQRGVDALNQLLEDASPLLRYAIDRKLSRFDLKDYGQKGVALKECLELLAPIKQSLMAQEYAGYIADRLLVEPSSVIERLAKTPVPRVMAMEDASSVPAQSNLASEQYASEGSAVMGTPAVQTAPLTAKQRQRLGIERELLCLCIAQPEVAFGAASVLMTTTWHDPAHEALSKYILDALEADPTQDSASLLMSVSALYPAASHILTASQVRDDVPTEVLAQFLLEEIAMGDLEESIFEVTRTLKEEGGRLSEEEYDTEYRKVVLMQAQLRDLRDAHASLGLLE